MNEELCATNDEHDETPQDQAVPELEEFDEQDLDDLFDRLQGGV